MLEPRDRRTGRAGFPDFEALAGAALAKQKAQGVRWAFDSLGLE
jgi:hypothetical protein